MEVDEIVQGMRGIGVPQAVGFVFGYAFLLLYLSVNDIFRISDAMKVKGVRLETWNPFTLAGSMSRMMTPAVFTVIRRGSIMNAVLEMRGFAFSGTRRRRSLGRWDLADAGVLATGTFIISGALLAE